MNTSDQLLENLTAVTTWYDNRGRFLKVNRSFIGQSPLLPGHTSPFRTTSSADPTMSGYTISVATLAGGTLPLEDLTHEPHQCRDQAAF